MSNVTTTTPERPGWEYSDLNEIDPTFKAVPADYYDLRVVKAAMVPFVYKPGNKAGVAEGTVDKYVKITLVITNHPEHAGRRIFPKPLFSGASSLKKLRRLADAAIFPQQPGQPLDTWLTELAQGQPVVRMKVIEVPDRQDPTATDNDVDWWSVQPIM